MKTIITRRPDIVFFVKLFLLNPNAENRKVATGIVCSRSMALLEDAFEKKNVPVQECTTKEIDENDAFAAARGITSAPALIFPDGTVQFGYLDAAMLEKRIDQGAGKTKTPSKN
jgi:thiol:disulfide interchange protein DsbC